MSNACSIHRLPRAGIDPIDSEFMALSMLSLMIDAPMRSETVVMLLDHEHRGISLLVVSRTVPFDSLFDVLDVVIQSQHPELGAIVVATIRPPAPGVPDLDEDDVDRWLEACEMVEDAGLELLEWFVIGATVNCPPRPRPRTAALDGAAMMRLRSRCGPVVPPATVGARRRAAVARVRGSPPRAPPAPRAPAGTPRGCRSDPPGNRAVGSRRGRRTRGVRRTTRRSRDGTTSGPRHHHRGSSIRIAMSASSQTAPAPIGPSRFAAGISANAVCVARRVRTGTGTGAGTRAAAAMAAAARTATAPIAATSTTGSVARAVHCASFSACGSLPVVHWWHDRSRHDARKGRRRA